MRVFFDDQAHLAWPILGCGRLSGNRPNRRPDGDREPAEDWENRPTTEIHLLDVAADLYYKTMVVEFLAFIRRERKFPSAAALVAQVKKDEQAARKLLQRHSFFAKQTLSG